MRYPEDKIKEAILHPDRDVRDTAVRYFSNSITADQTLMPLAIEAIEKYGRPEAFSLTHYLNRLPQTEQTVAWVVAELQREFQGPPEEHYSYFLNLSRLLCHADIRLVAQRAAEISQAPHFDPKERPAFREQLEIFGWNAETCWNELRKCCEDNTETQNVEEFDLEQAVRTIGFDLGHAFRIVKALARQPHDYQGQIVAILSEPVPDFRRDPRNWLQPLMATLAGDMRLREAILPLVGNLGHPNSYLSNQSMFALAQIGNEEVVSVVCDRFPGASREFNRAASDLLGKIHLDVTVRRVMELLPGETDLRVRMTLCEALLNHFSFEGIEPARQFIKQQELSPNLRQLRSILIATCKIMDVRFSEFEVWQEEARKDVQDQWREMQEHRKMLCEAGGDMGLLVNKLQAEVARKQLEIKRLMAEVAREEKALADQNRPQVSPSRPRLPDHQGRPIGSSASERVQVGRNDPCPCRSGKKFKHCCMKNQTGY